MFAEREHNVFTGETKRTSSGPARHDQRARRLVLLATCVSRVMLRLQKVLLGRRDRVPSPSRGHDGPPAVSQQDRRRSRGVISRHSELLSFCSPDANLMRHEAFANVDLVRSRARSECAILRFFFSPRHSGLFRAGAIIFIASRDSHARVSGMLTARIGQ